MSAKEIVIIAVLVGIWFSLRGFGFIEIMFTAFIIGLVYSWYKESKSQPDKSDE